MSGERHYRHDDLNFILRLSPQNHWAAYVGVPTDHKWHGWKSITVSDIKLHRYPFRTILKIDDEELNELWWFGVKEYPFSRIETLADLNFIQQEAVK